MYGERFGGGQKSTVGGAGVWTGARDRAEDGGLFGAAGLPAAATGEAAQAGAVGGPGIALDVDRPADLHELAAASGERRSQKLVRSWNLGAREQACHG